MDHILIINQVLEKSAQCNKPIYMPFRDYEKAFDSINTAAVIKALKDQRIDGTYLRLLQDILRDARVG